MHDIILHHYEFSTFSEKVRIALGLKQMAWRSVDIPGMPPRPLLSPLTGGYRRAPVLQVGADIYCDTHAILGAIERMRPEPSVFPAGSKGLARGVGFAWERQMWIPTIGVLVHYIGEHIPPEFLKDRREGYLGVDISRQAMAPQFQEHVQFVRAQIACWPRRWKAALSCLAMPPAPPIWPAGKPSSCCARTARPKSMGCWGWTRSKAGTSASSPSATASPPR